MLPAKVSPFGRLYLWWKRKNSYDLPSNHVFGRLHDSHVHGSEEIQKETLPKPSQSQIEFRKEPAKRVAAISFGGWANDEKLEKYKEK